MTQKIALITGASRGLGAAIAEALAPSHHIVAVARTTGALEDLDDRIKAKGGAATLAPMDITVPEAMATLCRGIYDRGAAWTSGCTLLSMQPRSAQPITWHRKTGRNPSVSTPLPPPC